MRFVFFANNRVGLDALRWLADNAFTPVALVVHPPEKAAFRDEMMAVAGLPSDRVFEGQTLRHPATVAAIRSLEPELGVSVLFDYLLQDELLSVFPGGCVNLHPALLPYNRGQYPNVWSIVEGTPSGVTLHYMDSGIDTGDIIAQKEVPVELTDTGETLYRKLEASSLDLFCQAWPLLVQGCAPRQPQTRGGGSYHRQRDVEAIDEIKLDAQYTARDMINLLRARTFPPHTGTYFVHEGRKIFLRLSLHEETF